MRRAPWLVVLTAAGLGAACVPGQILPRAEESANLADSDAGASDGGPSLRGVAINGVLTGPGALVTQRYDEGRTGATRDEEVLTAENVARLELLTAWPVDGQIYAQVLVAEDVEVAGQRRALALVATMENMLFAFDLDAVPAAPPVWRLGSGRELGGPLYSARNIGGNNGILATPVVDPRTQRLYLVSRDCDPGSAPEAPVCEQRLFAIDLATGAVVQSVAIHGSVPVASPTTGETASEVVFDPVAQWSRAALLLHEGRVFVTMAPGPNGQQHEGDFVYHGWVFAYDAADLTRAPQVYCSTPHGRGGGIWQAGSGPAADQGGVYFVTGNGVLDGADPTADFPDHPRDQEDSAVRLPATGDFPGPDQPVPHYFDGRPYHPDGNVFQYMERNDCELGSSGPMLIPGSRRLVFGSKPGMLYVLDRDTLQATQEPLDAFRSLPLQPGHTRYLHGWWGIPPVHQAPVYWRPDDPRGLPDRHGWVYAWASDDVLKSFQFDNDTGLLEEHASAPLPASPGGGNLTVSARGGDPASAVLWATSREGTGGMLRAFDPTTLKVLVQAYLPAWSRFTPPTVARGRVIVPSTSSDTTLPQQVLVYGLRAP
jgi:hypothetical protein